MGASRLSLERIQGELNGRRLRVKAIIWREEDMYVIMDVAIGVTTQGKSLEEALENLKEALELEEFPEERGKLEKALLVEVEV